MSKFKSYIIDRRKNKKGNSITNRNKFLRRVSTQIKSSIPKVLGSQSIKDIKTINDVKITLKGVDEPTFTYDTSIGINHRVLPGNKDIVSKFVEGDEIPKPENGKGKGKKGSKDGSGEDDFVVTISRDEFLDYFFEDLELPDLTRKMLKSVDEFKVKRAGFKKDGSPNNIDLVKSFKGSLARRISMQSSIQGEIDRLENEYRLNPSDDLLSKIDELKKRLDLIPYFDDMDLRYRRFEITPEPSLNAVMFCIMDISGSMGQREKDIARRFFTLLYLFLSKQYPKVELVFIQHHTIAKEVNEEEFFNSKENGGTVIYPAIKLCNDIINERYSGYNIYVSQVSDGDTWDKQDAIESTSLISDMLGNIQYMAYIEVLNDYRAGFSDLWSSYNSLLSRSNFDMKSISNINEIWSVFKKLFDKKSV